MADRYSRLLRYSGLAPALPQWQAAHCAVVGLGGLGGGLVQHLARLGVRRLVLVDGDIVAEENLGHQLLYTASDAQSALPKAHAAAQAARAVNPGVTVEAQAVHLTRLNIHELLAGVTLIFDGLDNYYTRLLLNDYAHSQRVPYFYAGAVRGELSARAVVPGVSGCLRCLLLHPPAAGEAPVCATEGVFPPLLGIANALQLDSASRYLAGRFTAADDVLTTLELPGWRMRRLALGGPRAACPVCGQGNYEYLCGAMDSLARQACAGERVEGQLPAAVDLNLVEQVLAASGEFEVRANAYCVAARCGTVRYTVFASGRLVLEGASDPVKLERFSAAYLGI